MVCPFDHKFDLVSFDALDFSGVCLIFLGVCSIAFRSVFEFVPQICFWESVPKLLVPRSFSVTCSILRTCICDPASEGVIVSIYSPHLLSSTADPFGLTR